jgi:hypothetical protein
LLPVAAFPWPFTSWLLPSGAVVGPVRHSISGVRAGGSHASHGTCRGEAPCVSHAPPVSHESTVAPPLASVALDPTHLRIRKSRRVSPSGPVA